MVRCKFCKKYYSCKSSFNRHFKEIHGPKVLCPFCFSYFGRISPHLLRCKIFLRHQINKLKIIGGEIYFVNESNKRKNKKTYKSKIKSVTIDDSIKIENSSFYYSQSMKIGSGSYCDVFYGFNRNTDNNYAVKIFKNIPGNYGKFLLEETMIKNLKDIMIFPSIYYSSRKNLILVESLLGPNLKKLFNFCDNHFPIVTVCYIGIEIISRLQDYHSKGYVHRDIKPSNMLWGNFSQECNESKDNILLIDYDLSGIYKNNNGMHISYEIEEGIIGNIVYKSINSHNLITQTRRDDIESLMYCLIYFFKGDLAWNANNVNTIYKKLNKKLLKKNKQNNEVNERFISKNEIICEFKKRMSSKILCENLPTEFEMILNYAKNLRFDEEPNYELIKDLFKE